MDYKNDDQMLLLSHYYPPPTFTQIDILPQQGDEQEKPRRIRRRKKRKLGESGNGTLNSGFRKRKLSEEQTNKLEMNFRNEHKLESERKDRLASELGLDPRQVAIWFQNRRARWKCKKLEEEYSKLKDEHESTVVEKCHLQSQVVKLKEQLSEAEKEKERLMKRSINGYLSNNNNNNNNSSCSSSSMEALELMDQTFLGEFMLDGLEDVLYVPEYDFIHGLEWVHFM